MLKFVKRASDLKPSADQPSGSGSVTQADRATVDADLDVGFYRSRYGDLAGLSDEAAARHWVEFGRAEGRTPNAEAAVLAHVRFGDLPADFNPVDYVFVNRDLPARLFEPLAATLHFLDYGLAEHRTHHSGLRDREFSEAYRRERAAPARHAPDARLTWSPRGLDQYLYVHGFASRAFVDHLDVEFYYQTSGLAARDAPKNRLACIFDFVEHGVEALRPIAEALAFDPDFYRRHLRRQNAAPGDRSDAQLYRLWLSRDDVDTFPPNHRQYMKGRFGVACAASEVIDLSEYRLANADLAGLDDEGLLEHVFEHGIFEGRTSISITSANVDVFRIYADHLAAEELEIAAADGSGEQMSETAPARAESLYLRLSHFVHSNQLLNQHAADLLVRAGRDAEAYRLYRRNMERGGAAKWTYLNAAGCCDRLGDLSGLVLALDEGCRAFPDDQGLRRHRAAEAERTFTDVFARARARAASAVANGRSLAGATALVAAAAAERDFGGADAPAPLRAIRTVALFANMDLAQCTLYRVEQKAEQLVAAGFDVRVFDWGPDRAAFERDMASFEAVIFFRVAAFPEIARLINAARSAGLATFYEIDDLVFDEAEFPEPLSDYAGQVSPLEYADLAVGVPLFRHAMTLCDYAIASTPSLAARMEPLVRQRRAFVHRNALGIRHERALETRRERAIDRPVTIFYGSGTKAHKLDLEAILLPALEEIGRRFGDAVRIVIAGHKPVGAGSDLLSRVTLAPFTPSVEDYWAELREADINLAVLRRTPLTNTKSEIKWLEAAMFGIPSVVSATDTFAEVVTEGVDAFVAANTAEFVDKISALVRDSRLREDMGAAARAKALRDYRVAPLAENLRRMFVAVTPPAPAREPIRVLVVNVFYLPQAKGGATRVVIDNIADLRALHGDDFAFEVFATLEGGGNPYEVRVSSADGVRVTAMTAGNDPGIDLAARDERAGGLFRACVERFRPHLIHFHCVQRMTASLTETALEMGIPYLITAHDGWWISDRQFLYGPDGPAPRYDFRQPFRHRRGSAPASFDRPSQLLPSLRGAWAILAVSEPFARLYGDTGLDNVRAVPNGLPRLSAALGERPLAIRPPGRAGERVRLAHLGGTEAHKGLPFLKYAIFAARPVNVSLLVVELALEPGEERFENWAGTPVRIIAKRPQNEVAALYEDIDVLFAPSLWPESYGLVTREAIAAGCWVVASDRGAIAEPVIEGVNGHVVQVETIEGLSGVLARIDAEPARYKASPIPQSAARTSSDQARDLAAIYRQMVEERPVATWT